jgi:glucosamine kinase
VYYMGIDGGGTSLRVVIVDESLTIVVHKEHDGVNPGKIGHSLAASRIQETVVAALREKPIEISACALGIAGAAASHSRVWLMETMESVLPYSLIVPSSDLEIALIGAHGKRYGLLLLSGTGSAAYGIDQHGNHAMVGGWGYLVDDLGSGYWIGNQALRYLIQSMDGRQPSDELSRTLLDATECRDRAELTRWIYHREDNIVSRIASLSGTILATAQQQVPVAMVIVEEAADHLEKMLVTLYQQLAEADHLPVCFGGSLLQQLNPLSERLMAKLKLSELPMTIYPPVVGAALLAKLHYEQRSHSVEIKPHDYRGNQPTL